MEYEPISGTPTRFPPGRVRIRLSQGYRRPYRTLYARYQSILAGVPVLRDRDFDGRTFTITATELDALNRALGVLGNDSSPGEAAFSSQEAGRSRLFKRLQYLS